MFPDPIISPKAETPAVGSRWYAFGRQVEVAEILTRDGEPHVRERDVRTGATFCPTPLALWKRRAVPVS